METLRSSIRAARALSSTRPAKCSEHARGLMDAATLDRALEPLAMARPDASAPVAVAPAEKGWENGGGYIQENWMV